MLEIKKKLQTSVSIVHAINIHIQSKRDGVRDRLESLNPRRRIKICQICHLQRLFLVVLAIQHED